MQVTLNIPALFAEFSEIDANVIDELNLWAFRKLLSRSVQRDAASMDFEAWLYRQFIRQECSEKQIPFASLTASLDGLNGGTGVWMRADPVYLYPDMHSLILQDPTKLNLTTDEREELADTIRPLFKDYGATLHTPSSTRWYLQFHDSVPELECTPIYDALMKPVNEYLPTGADYRRWHTLFNEIQMLLNQSTVNENREYYGLQPVNSLWFWGLGKSPENPGSAFDCCIGGDAYVQALCQHTANRHKSLIDGISVSRYQNNALVLEDRLLIARRLNDPALWLNALQLAEEQVIRPLLDGLWQGDIQQLNIMSDSHHQFDCTSGRIKSFWKRSRPISLFLLH